MYYFIKYAEQENENYISWGSEDSPLNEEQSKFFNKLLSLIPVKEK